MYMYVSVCICMHMYVYVCICMHMYAYVCIRVYMCVHVCTCMFMYVYVCICLWMYVNVLICTYVCGGWFKLLYLQTATLREWKNIFANPTFIFRGVAAIRICAAETHSISMQTVTVRDVRQTAKGKWKAMLGKFHQEIAEFHCLPRSLGLPLQRCCVGYSLPWTPSLSPLLSRNFRKTFAKSPLQINRKIHTLNRGWGFSSIWLQYSQCLGLFSACQ